MKSLLHEAEETILLSSENRHSLENDNKKPQRVIGIKPVSTGYEAEKPAVPDFSSERAAVLEKAKKQAETIIAEAEAKKKQLMEEAEAWQEAWHQEKEILQLKAYEEAYEQGAIQGREAGYLEVSSLIDEAKSVVDSSKVEYEKNVERSEQTILDLALACAEKILQAELEKNSELFMGIVKAAIKEARNQKEVQIHVHPGKYEFVVSQKDEIEALFPSDVNCYIFPNEDAEKEACFVETANGRIDASVDAQLQQLRKILFSILERA